MYVGQVVASWRPVRKVSVRRWVSRRREVRICWLRKDWRPWGDGGGGDVVFAGDG